jgi:hypothetical protein
MTMPIQTAPIDRGNRALGAAAASQGITPQRIDLGDIIGIGSAACALLPPPLSLVCSVLAKLLAK